MGSGNLSLSNSMCQKRSGWPRSTTRKRLLTMMNGSASKCPRRMADRSATSPNRSSQAAAKYTPPVTPPAKKYRTIHQPQFGTWKLGLKSAGIGVHLWRSAVHATFAHREHAGDAGQHGRDQAQ